MKRVLLVAVLVASVYNPATGATAAPKKVCKLLGASTGATVDGPNAALDILSADIASNARHVTTVIRMRTLDDPQSAVTGRAFSFYFSRSVEESYVMSGTLWGSKPSRFHLGEVSSPFHPQANSAEVKNVTWLGEIDVVVDTARHEVRMTAPTAAFRHRAKGTQVKPGARVNYLAADVTRMYGADRGASPVPLPDQAPSELGTGGRWTYGGKGIGYVLGTPSCVTPGR